MLASDIRPTELNKIIIDIGLELVGLQPFRDYEAMPEPYKTRSLERAKHKFELMHQLGTKKIFICSNTSNFTINNLDKAAEDLFDIAELAKKEGFEIGYEALYWGKFVNTYHQSVEIVRRANHPNLGNVLDNFHISAVGSDFGEIYTIPKEKITIVQIADALKYDMGAMHLGRHYRCFPGQGSFPVVEYMKAVQATGYDGYISHEIFSDEFRSSPIEPVALDGKRSLIWLEENTTKVVLKKIEFIEFATDTESQIPLIELLQAIGFVETFQHKTKSVSIYEIGEIKIVLNSQANTSNLKNTVSAIGFIINNKQIVEKKAKKMFYHWQEGSQTPNELNIPFVKGVANIFYYLIDENQMKEQFYEVEFNRTKAKKVENGICQIDHIGHSTIPDLYQSTIFFYRALFGLNVEESLEILDPRGIVFSRVAKNDDGNIRIPLSSTRSQKTFLNEFISQSGGSGIQQIALQTNDIFQTTNSIQNKSFILPISNNYYDDLRAKTALSDGLIEKLQANNILYDLNSDGVFFHFYCKELNGIFFEIVQRVGNYNRFGEINAQIRLSSQARNR